MSRKQPSCQRNSGKPVKISWTREEDIHFDYFHATSAMYFKAGLDASGKPQSWLLVPVFPPIGSIFDEKEQYGAARIVPGLHRLALRHPEHSRRKWPAEAHCASVGCARWRTSITPSASSPLWMSWRHAAGQDPVEYWLAALGEPRKIDLGSRKPSTGTTASRCPLIPLDTGRLRASRKSSPSNPAGPIRNLAKAELGVLPLIAAS